MVEVLSAYWKFAKGYYVKNGVVTNEVAAIRLIIADVKSTYGRMAASDDALRRRLFRLPDLWPCSQT